MLICADEARGLYVWNGGVASALPCPIMPPGRVWRGQRCFYVSGGQPPMIARYERRGPRCVFPGVNDMTRLCASPCGRYLYLLSGDSDQLTACRAQDGGLLFSNQAGVYPQGMSLSADGRWLAAAGGASGEVLIMEAPGLRLERRICVPGSPCRVCFHGRRLLILCSVEDRGELAAAVYSWESGQLMKLALLPGLAGDMAVQPDGSVIASAFGHLCCLSRSGRMVWRAAPPGLPDRFDLKGGLLLAADQMQEELLLAAPGSMQTLITDFRGSAVFHV